VIACFASSVTTISGAKIARLKESDRITAIAKELRKMGAQIEEKDDGLIIHPSKLRGAELSSHKDHRIALSLIIAAMGSQGESVIDEVECIGKTYPMFFYDFVSLGARIS
jgi:3-phosphoshikimate 1-carboxyvinyltransferase